MDYFLNIRGNHLKYKYLAISIDTATYRYLDESQYLKMADKPALDINFLT